MLNTVRLYHYYERSRGPFRSISDLSDEEAARLLEEIKQDPRLFASARPPDYLDRRRELEATAQRLFIEKGGRPVRRWPHYFVVEPCPWLESWYIQPASVSVALAEVDPAIVSFSYGDLFPTFSRRVHDGREYRGRIYTLTEILDLIERYGYPQDWNADGQNGPERYIEAQVWDDRPAQMAGG